MDIKPGYSLKFNQRADPILWRSTEVILGIDSERILTMLTDHLGIGRSKRLTTWGRDPLLPNSAHWIGVRNGTTLHVDPRYPQYTHQLVVHNQGWGVAGITKILADDPFGVGTVFCCDTHSPHILVPDCRLECANDPYYLAASIDAKDSIQADDVVSCLLKFLADWRQTC